MVLVSMSALPFNAAISRRHRWSSEWRRIRSDGSPPCDAERADGRGETNADRRKDTPFQRPADNLAPKLRAGRENLHIMSTLFNCRDEEDGQPALHGDFNNPEMRYDRNSPTGLSGTAASEPKPRQFRQRSGDGAQLRRPRLPLAHPPGSRRPTQSPAGGARPASSIPTKARNSPATSSRRCCGITGSRSAWTGAGAATITSSSSACGGP